MTESIAAVVPVLNEEAAIGPLVNGLRRAGACCVLVVDSGSRDATVEVARSAGARVVHESRRGYGRACLTGARAALDDCSHTAVAFLDGDGSCDPDDLPHLARFLVEADAVLGRRTSVTIERGAMPWHARLGNRLVAAILTARSGRSVHDLPPFKLVRRELLEGLAPDDAGYGWTVQVVARLLMTANARVLERPARFRRRVGGRSKVSGSLRASLIAATAMLRGAWRETAPRPAFVLVAKAPRPGGVKTRLAPSLGAVGAAELWRASLADTAHVLSAAAAATRGMCLVVVPDRAAVEPVLACVGDGWDATVQEHRGLEGAIVDGFTAAARRGATRCVVVSGDNPDLPVTHLAAALRLLERHDAVLGPTLDGGYHLVGMAWKRRPTHPGRQDEASRRADRLERALSRARMGTRNAAAATARGLRAEGWTLAASPTWPDLDTIEDLASLETRLADASPDVAPLARAWLARRKAASA